MANPTTDSLTQTIDNPEAYFISLGAVTENELSYGRSMPTSLTYSVQGPFQHEVPPPALLTRMLERYRLKSKGMHITRIAVDSFSAVPYTELRTRSWVPRPGRRIVKVEARLLTNVRGVWRPVATVSVWMMAMADMRGIEHAFDRHVPGPVEGIMEYIPLTEDWSSGYIESIKARAAATEDDAGTQIHWVRAPHPIVLGEEPAAVERVVQVADIANGIGIILGPYQWAFMNADLVAHLHRFPQLGTSEKSVELEP